MLVLGAAVNAAAPFLFYSLDGRQPSALRLKCKKRIQVCPERRAHVRRCAVHSLPGSMAARGSVGDGAGACAMARMPPAPTAVNEEVSLQEDRPGSGNLRPCRRR